MNKEIGIDYTFDPKELLIEELEMNRFSYTRSFFNGKEFMVYTQNFWVHGSRHKALQLVNRWNTTAFIQSNETSIYSYHLNP